MPFPSLELVLGIVKENKIHAPILPETIQSIQNILEEYTSSLSRPVKPAANYKELQEHLFYLELSDELRLLRDLFTQDNTNISNQFTQHCAERAQSIHNTCLAFNISCHSPCNRMYWQIASKLFSPKTMSKMLLILQPQVLHKITFELFKSGKPPYLFPTQERLYLEEPPELQTMSYFIFESSYFLDVRDFACLNYEDHQKLERALPSIDYVMAIRLYQHNTDWQQLAFNLALVPNGFRRYTNDDIFDLVRVMLLRGTYGYDIRDDSGVSFPGYKGRMLLAKYFQSVLEDSLIDFKELRFIRPFNEVRWTELLQDIIGKLMDPNQPDRELINQIRNLLHIEHLPLFYGPVVSDKRWKTVSSQYGQDSTILRAGCEISACMPERYQEYELSSVTIHDRTSFMSWLLTCPPTDYSALLRYASIDSSKLPDFLAFDSDSEMLTRKQEIALVHALAENMKKMGGWEYLSLYVLRNHRLFESIIDMIVDGSGFSYQLEYRPEDRLLFQKILETGFQNPHAPSLLMQLSCYYRSKLIGWAKYWDFDKKKIPMTDSFANLGQTSTQATEVKALVPACSVPDSAPVSMSSSCTSQPSVGTAGFFSPDQSYLHQIKVLVRQFKENNLIAKISPTISSVLDASSVQQVGQIAHREMNAFFLYRTEELKAIIATLAKLQDPSNKVSDVITDLQTLVAPSKALVLS
jgi:hypothetical protein